MNVKLGSGEVRTANTSMHFISQGSTANFRQHLLVHITFNANGEITSDVQRTTLSCN